MTNLFKTSRSSYWLTYMNVMVTTSQKPTIDTHEMLEEKGTKRTSKENHQTTKEGAKNGGRGREELQTQPGNKWQYTRTCQ